MHLYQTFKEYLNKESLYQKGDRWLIAVSGGVDSVMLCHLASQSNISFEVMHCNFNLRGEESVRDENFVKALADNYGVVAHVEHFDTNQLVEEKKTGIQETARKLRYNWFSHLCAKRKQDTGLNYFIATAHHADDNIETICMNFFKGTGIRGLRGILPRQNNIIRPLLFADKSQIMQAAATINLEFVEDASNLSDKYTRNYFRHQIIPAIEKSFPATIQNLNDNALRFREIEVLYQQALSLHLKQLMFVKRDEVHIPVLKLKKAKPLHTILYEMIVPFGFTSAQTTEVVKLLDSESGKYISSGSHRILKDRKWLLITPLKHEVSEHILIEPHQKAVSFSEGVLHFAEKKRTSTQINNESSIAQLNADIIQFPLILRRWRQGDYFYPLGMSGKKKLSRYFIDKKLSLADKGKVWVLEMNQKIIWVVGMRLDDRFKLRDSNRQVLEIKHTPH